jgi:hypothetical protein
MQNIDKSYECPICMENKINLRLIDTYEKCSNCSRIFSLKIICKECFKNCSNACPFCRSKINTYYEPINFGNSPNIVELEYYLNGKKISIPWNASRIHKKTYCQKYDLINEFKNVNSSTHIITRTNIYPSIKKRMIKKKNLIKEFIETFKKLWTAKKKISKDNKITGAHIIMNFNERSEKNNISIFDKFTFSFKFKNHKFIINDKVKDNINKKESEYDKVMMKSLNDKILMNDKDYDNKKMRKLKKKCRLKKSTQNKIKKCRLKKSTQNKIKKEYVKKKKSKYHNFYRGQKITN